MAIFETLARLKELIKFPISLVALILLFSLSMSTAKAEDTQSVRNPTCIHDQAVHHLPIVVSPIRDQVPCSSLGAAFLIGFGGEASSDIVMMLFNDEKLFDQHPVYAHFRLYLFDVANLTDTSIWDANNFANLLLASTYLDGANSGMDAQKIKHYKGFVLLEYWSRYEDVLSRSTQDSLARSIQHVLRDSDLGTTNELRCFILYDFPVLTFDEVVASAGYQVCLEEVEGQ